MASVGIWLKEIRLPFLLLVPVCVLVGASVAVWESYDINVVYITLAFIGALLSHIAVNVLNEYFDYKSGVDFNTVRTPFSGGSGMLTEGHLNARNAYILGVSCLVGVAAIGAYFIYEHGAAIIPLGILGIITVYFYTTHLTKSPLLCAIAPGLGFGPLMVLGTYFAMTGGYSLAAGLASLIPGFLVSNLLLLNQFPDVEADAVAERRHLPIVVGRKVSSEIYASLIAAAYIALLVSVLVGELPYMALFGLLTLPLGVLAVKGALMYYNQIEKLVPTMGQNVILTLLLPVLMAVGIIVS